MKIEVEWVYPETEIGPVPVVRLSQVDTIMREAVWAMEMVSSSIYQRMMWHAHKDEDYQRAQAFLASVAEWRKREEGKGKR